MAENTINEILEYYSNLKDESEITNEVAEVKDVEDSFNSVEEIGRLAYNSKDIEKRRHINLGTILKNALQRFLPKNTSGMIAKIDPDWWARFIDYAKDVSDDEMRLIWSRILSGELNKPNSISVMTLETLRNMSKRDAEIFHKLANFAVVDTDGGDPFIPNNGIHYNAEQKSDEEYGIRYDELLWMQELRLINLNMGMQMTFNKEENEPLVESILRCGNLEIIISSESEIQIPCYSYTRVGAQLLSLIEDITPNEAFFEDRIKKRYSSENTKIDINK